MFVLLHGFRLLCALLFRAFWLVVMLTDLIARLAYVLTGWRIQVRRVPQPQRCGRTHRTMRAAVRTLPVGAVARTCLLVLVLSYVPCHPACHFRAPSAARVWQHPVTGLTTASLEAVAEHTADASRAAVELGYGRTDGVGGADGAGRYVDSSAAMRAAALWAAGERERALEV